MNIDFTKAVVGQSVYSPEHGEGEILRLYHIRSELDELYIRFSNAPRYTHIRYKSNGKKNRHSKHPSLFHDKREWQDYVASTRGGYNR